MLFVFIACTEACSSAAKFKQHLATSLRGWSAVGASSVRSIAEAAVGGLDVGDGPNTSAPQRKALSAGKLPWVYTELWSAHSPLRQTVASLKSKGAVVLPQNFMNDLWKQGLTNYGLTGGVQSGMPMYFSKTSDPLVTVICTMYGGKCNASNDEVHLNSHDLPQSCTGACSDNHIIVIDEHAPKGPVEVDCWQTKLLTGTLACSWAGAYALGTDALHEPGSGGGSEGFHGGPAGSAMIITGQELANGHIDHALGMTAECMNKPTIYPADVTETTDTQCDDSTNPPHYGNLVHLVTPLSQIQARGYSAPCMVVLTAFQTYGAYLIDTGNLGLSFDTQSDASYTTNPETISQNPWPQIQAEINAAGDGSGNNWQDCLQRLSAGDLELLQIAKP